MFCHINRILYVVLLLFSAIAALALIMPQNSFDLTEVEPVKIAVLSIPSSTDLSAIDQPSRNIFDKDGHVWQKPRGANGGGKSANKLDNSINDTGSTATTVLGLIRLRGIDGILTLQGFVPIGKVVNGGDLVSVGNGKYTLDFEGQQKVFAVDENRERRRKRFESLGLPFLN